VFRVVVNSVVLIDFHQSNVLVRLFVLPRGHVCAHVVSTVMLHFLNLLPGTTKRSLCSDRYVYINYCHLANKCLPCVTVHEVKQYNVTRAVFVRFSLGVRVSTGD